MAREEVARDEEERRQCMARDEEERRQHTARKEEIERLQQEMVCLRQRTCSPNTTRDGTSTYST